MKVIKFAVSVGLVFAVSLFLSFDSQKAWSAEKENYCFTCHTNARKLIKITREIAEANKGKEVAEAEGGG
ncbi:MAG: hypothetical protein SRB1_02769 [Desulfobacteraceae bacterium Eth-SRB1]|nr:MAG: hypothetical protein SRB1_02769 [Desulfobacteraceae bacterium Eth-SRB1]